MSTKAATLLLLFLSLDSVYTLLSPLRAASTSLAHSPVASTPTTLSIYSSTKTSASATAVSLFFSRTKARLLPPIFALHSSSSSTTSPSSFVSMTNHYEPDRSATKSSTVFIGNLPFTASEVEIENIIKENMGPNLVKGVQIIRGAKSKRPMGYGFIQFHEYHIALQGVEFFDGLVYGDRTLNSNLKDQDEAAKSAALKKKKMKNVRNYQQSIHLSNLDYSLTEQELVNMCDDVLGPGQVDYVNIPLDVRSKSPKGYAQIQFTSTEAVERALIEFNGLEVFDRLLKCDRLKAPKDIGKKLPKDERNETGGQHDHEELIFSDNFDTME